MRLPQAVIDEARRRATNGIIRLAAPDTLDIVDYHKWVVLRDVVVAFVAVTSTGIELSAS